MSVIPADVLKAAKNAAYATELGGNDAAAITSLTGVDIIAHAILSERQRCADIADKERQGFRDHNLPQCALGAYQVAKAILAGDTK